MSEIAETTAHEEYAFACMRCGYGWEQAYEIEHHVDGKGQPFVVYKADGERVPSPLSQPTCANCGGHVVRTLRAGRVSSVTQWLAHHSTHQAPAGPVGSGGDPEPDRPKPSAAAESAADEAATDTAHHWHLSDLLHPFHHHKK
ncbi:hypothetical protein [Streptomyces sp. CBMA152]|uniref:hypothetical protein n=1 Tax=Streptomyces sp. CBMA152 TaxID=1896312 RepID=UPI001661107B|nr:hypothetical protein [Streptomyces sp. CBMA152]MBD0746488.1 hypothetical protein [Streptomyces sp. CBMA152]